MLEGVGPTIIAGDLAHELGGTTDHFIEVLDDQVVNLLCTQQRFGYFVQLVSDVNRTVCTLQLGQRLGQAAVAAGDIVDSDNIRLRLQQFSSGIIGGFVGVLAFNDLEDFDAFKLLAHDRTEPNFAIFMAAVGKAANHDGYLSTRTPFQMPPHQLGSDVASRSVVNAEIGRTGR